MKKLTLNDVILLVKQKKGNVLSKKYINIDSKLKIKCKKGHIWRVTFGNLKKGTWCPKCACWSKEEMDFLKKNIQLSSKEIAKKINRSVYGVENKKRKMFLCKKIKNWDKEEINYIRNNCKRMALKQICKNLNRSISSVKNKKYKEKINGFYYIMEESTKKKISEKLKGKNLNEKNGQWKGDKVTLPKLHEWIRRHKLPTGVCNNCKRAEKKNIETFDLANISGKYKRDIDDFEWLCRRCHMIKDGRLQKLHVNKRNTQLNTLKELKGGVEVCQK